MTAPGRDRLCYEVVDVFAPRPFTSNQLAVVLDAADLTTDQCQADVDSASLRGGPITLEPGPDPADLASGTIAVPAG